MLGLTTALLSKERKAHARGRVSLNDFGAVGDGINDDSPAWHRFIKAAANNGEGFIPAGHYRLDKVKSFAPRKSGLRLTGEGSDKVLLEGTRTKNLKVFSLIDASLHISGISTKNLCLIEAHKTITQDIPHLIINDWHWENDAAQGIRAVSVFSPYEDVPYKIDQVKVTSVFGLGGVCGLWLRTAMRQCEMDDVEIRDILVPENERWYYKSKPNRMNDIGTACGVLIGDDTTQAQAHFERCLIGRVVIDGVRDDRPLRELKSDPTNCDGMRLLASNVRFDDLAIRRVTNHARRDCTGLYTKVVDMRGDRLTIENAGHHEASLTFKGASASPGRKGAYGKNIQLNVVNISNTEGFVGRPAVYLSCDNVTINSLDVFGCGGDVEDPYNPGQRIPGASSVIRMSPPLKKNPTLGKVKINHLVMRECVLGGTSERWAVGLGGYREITLGDVMCTGLSNAGRFIGQEPDLGQDISVIAFAETTIPCDNLTIGKVIASDCHAPGRVALVVNLMGRAPMLRARLGSIKSDITFSNQVKITGPEAIKTFDWQNCDPKSIKIETPPVNSTISSASNEFCIAD